MLHTVREVSRAHDSGRHYVSQSRQRTHCNTSSHQWGRPQAWSYVHSKLVHSCLVAMGTIRSRLTGRVCAAHHARHAPHTPPPPVQCRAVREHGWLASEGTGAHGERLGVSTHSQLHWQCHAAVPASLPHPPPHRTHSGVRGHMHAPGEEPGTEATVVPSPEPLNSPSKPEDHGWLLL